MGKTAVLQNKTVLVSGGNRGIGQKIVEAFLEKGAKKVYVGVRDLNSAAHLIEKYPDRVELLQIDYHKPQTFASAAQKAHDVEIVINNAGILKKSSPLSNDAVDFLKEEMEVNVYGLIRMARAFAPVLRANHGGAFVQMNSIASMKCFTDFSTYSASKAAAYVMTQGLRDVLSDQDTLVVSVHPGPIDTDMAEHAGLGEIAEPPEVVVEGIITALEKENFLVFPDQMAQEIGNAYENFGKSIVEANLMEK